MLSCTSSPSTGSRASSRRRSTRSTTCTTSPPRRTPQSSRRTATPHTRTSGWICALNRWLSRCRRSRRTATIPSSSSTAIPTISATSAPRHGKSEPGDYLVVGPDWKGETPTGIKKVVPVDNAVHARAFPHSTLQSRRHAERRKMQAGYKAQPLSAFLGQAAAPAAPKIDFLPATTAGIKDNFFQYLDAALQFVPRRKRTRLFARNSQDRHRSRQDLRFQGSVDRTQSRDAWWP